jgi:hypothetical protein
VRALDALAGASGRAEVARCPIVLFGHSSAGQLVAAMSSVLAGRTAGFVVYKGGARTRGGAFVHEKLLMSEEHLRVPGLVVVAERDPAGLRDASIRLVQRGRARGARWALAIEPGGGHCDLGATRGLTVPFVEEVLGARLGPGGLADLDEGAGRLGQLSFHREGKGEESRDVVDRASIWRWGRYPWERAGGQWLVSARFALAWLRFARGGR